MRHNHRENPARNWSTTVSYSGHGDLNRAFLPLTLKASHAARAGLLGGLISGLAGALFFAMAHAIIIVPIWTRLGSGLILGALAGAAAGWALAENFPAILTLRARSVAVSGARFGATLWLLVTPVTAADALLRELGIAPRLELVAVGVAVALPAATLGGMVLAVVSRMIYVGLSRRDVPGHIATSLNQ